MADEQRPLLFSDHHRVETGHETSYAAAARHQTKRYLTSKTGHYSVLLLVSLDISCIFADLILQLLTCEGRVPEKNGETAQQTLGNIALVFSCLFMLELLASIWAFGWKFFYSWFHCLDALVIVAGFLIDVCLRGVLEEIGSLVVVLRLWRVLKIIEELSAGAAERMEPLEEQIEELRLENGELRHEIEELKAKQVPHVF